MQADCARRRRLGVFSLQHLARRSGEGASPDSTHQLLCARRGRAAAARAPGEHSAQLSPNGEVYKQKRAPHGSPAGLQAAQRLRNHRTCKRVRRGLHRAWGPNTQPPGTPRPDQSLSARPENAALNAPSQISLGSPALCADPRTLLLVRPAASAARIAKASAQAASPKTQAWRCPSQGQRHTQTRTHTHALP